MPRPGAKRMKPKGFHPGSKKGAVNVNGTSRQKTKIKHTDFKIKKR